MPSSKDSHVVEIEEYSYYTEESDDWISASRTSDRKLKTRVAVMEKGTTAVSLSDKDDDLTEAIEEPPPKQSRKHPSAIQQPVHIPTKGAATTRKGDAVAEAPPKELPPKEKLPPKERPPH